MRERMRDYFYIALFAIGSVGFLFSADYVFENVLEPHQQVRIKVVLGMEEDLAGAGYNVNQSKIAIGSGGLLGKGFLNGTQTKLKYVPEQDTDFIFCTVGEEEGFLGSAIVLLLFMTLILRLIVIAERQHTLWTCIWLLGAEHLPVSSLYQYRNGTRINAGNRYSIAFLQLWRLFFMGFHHPAFVFLRIDSARGSH